MEKIPQILMDEKVREVLKKAIEAHQRAIEKYGDSNLGFEWYEVQAAPQLLNKLVREGFLVVSYKSNKSTMYKVVDPKSLAIMIEQVEQMIREGEVEAEYGPVEIPPDLFSIIVGHDDVKEVINRSLQSESPVHILLHGSIASAKTMFLEELARLPKSRFVVGSSLTKAGLIEVLFEDKPRFLIIDELDKIETEDNLAALLSLMERGIVTETKYRRHRSLTLKTTVFASANRVERIPPELLSRFLKLYFRDYTPQEFIEVTVDVLTKREKISPQVAFHIGEKVLRELGSKDVRDCVKIARLLKQKTIEEVDGLVELLKKRSSTGSFSSGRYY
jgi:Holliday junction DNA helicase RuvB